jgi:environmental stress-induced protein Ves
MIEIFKKSDFKSMPWKNGVGITTELFLLPVNNSNSFLFRLSLAKVTLDGPFSIFPNIDRILLLIEGHGFNLKSPERKVELNKKLAPFIFKGEEAFTCKLLDGPCVDFNIMTDRSYAQSMVSVIHSKDSFIKKTNTICDLMFIYDINNEVLYKLEKNDELKIEVQQNSTLFIIETNLI